jgi:hypothetical protein
MFSSNSKVIKPPGLSTHEVPLEAASCRTDSAPETAPSKLKILTGTMCDLLNGARILLSHDPGKIVSRGKDS